MLRLSEITLAIFTIVSGYAIERRRRGGQAAPYLPFWWQACWVLLIAVTVAFAVV
jgi:hypothetical protein